MNQVLAELYGALGWIGMLIPFFQVVVVRYLILDHLINLVLLLCLVKRVGGTRQRIHCKSGWTLSEVLPNLQIRVNACSANDLHGFDIEYEQMVRVEGPLLLIDEWEELILLLHIVE